MFIFRPNIQNAGDVCSPGTVKCDPNDIYYSLNGSCNNLDIPFWAQVKIPFVRLLPANYSDGKLKNKKYLHLQLCYIKYKGSEKGYSLSCP